MFVYVVDVVYEWLKTIFAFLLTYIEGEVFKEGISLCTSCKKFVSFVF